MTLLAPDIPVLPHLERIGAALLQADSTVDAIWSREHLAEFQRRALQYEAMATAAREAERELDGMYDVTRETAGLIRALQAACVIAGKSSPDLRTAAGHLKLAAKAVQAAMAKADAERAMNERDARRDAEIKARWDALAAEQVECAA